MHNGYKKDVEPIKENEVTTYQDFYDRSIVGDNLEGHEVLQNARLKENGAITKPRLIEDSSKNNPVIALTNSVHKDVNSAQRALDIANQTALENIEANIKILQDLGIPKESTEELYKLALEHAKNLGF